MDIAVYSEKATSFALGAIHNDQVYFFLGLASELGEVADKVKKQIRDSEAQFSDLFKKNLALELGDCFWYINSICHISKLTFDPYAFDLNYLPQNEYDCRSLAYMILETHNLVKFDGFTETGEIMVSQTLINDIINKLSKICHAIGYPSALVLQLNIDKLNSRKANNTISGSGDYR